MSSARKRISKEMNKIFANSVDNYIKVHQLPFSYVYGYDPKSNRNDLSKIKHIELNMVHANILKDRYGMLMAVIPSSHLLNLQALNDILERELVPLHFSELKAMLFGCNTGKCPPLPDVYGTDVVFDHSIEYMPEGEIYFSAGEKNKYVCMQLSDFKKLHSNINYEIFSEACDSLSEPWHNISYKEDSSVLKSFVHKRMKGRVVEVKDFPAMPPIAEAVLQMRLDQSATATDLADIIARDPSLAAQVISWAKSAYYGYDGEITSIEDAIVKVLGFDLVMNLVLCIAVGKTLGMQLNGPIGLRETWRTSIYVSVVIDALTKIIPAEHNINPGYAFLAGLIHNFGYMLLGHVFPTQFDLLNNMLTCNQHIAVGKVEQHTLGLGHEHLGMWLLKEWQMPEEIIAGVGGHHIVDFDQQHKQYANLALIALRLLKRYNIGDEKEIEIPNEIITEFDLTVTDLNNVIEQVMSKQDDLDHIIKCLLK